METALRLVGALGWFWILSDYEAEAGSWAVEVWGIVGDGPPPGTHDAYAICGFTAGLVTEMSRDGGPRAGEPCPRRSRATARS